VSDYPYPIDDGRTHSAGCWRWRGHHNCAVRKVEVMAAMLRRVECDDDLDDVREAPVLDEVRALLAEVDGETT